MILLVGIIVAGATYLYYKRKASTYQVGNPLYLSGGSEESAGTEKAAGQGQR